MELDKMCLNPENEMPEIEETVVLWRRITYNVRKGQRKKRMKRRNTKWVV